MTLPTTTVTPHQTTAQMSPTDMAPVVLGRWAWPETACVELEWLTSARLEVRPSWSPPIFHLSFAPLCQSLLPCDAAHYVFTLCIHAGLKLDFGDSTDATEASALGYRDYHIDIYSNSWGPSDFGFIVDGPGTLVKNTFVTGVTEVSKEDKVTLYIPAIHSLSGPRW